MSGASRAALPSLAGQGGDAADRDPDAQHRRAEYANIDPAGLAAGDASDLFGALLVVGVLGHIAIQVILNVAVVTNSMPNTGVSLPFISYGGSSILFLLIEMGLVMSVARGIKVRDV